MADCASDVRDICAATGVGKLAMWGVSGGPYVLARAALLPDLVTDAACMCLPAPYDAEGLVWGNNPQERLNEEIRRRTDVVGIFPGPAGDHLAGRRGAGRAERRMDRARRYMGTEMPPPAGKPERNVKHTILK